MAQGTPLPFVKAQWFDNNADPASGYKLFVYDAGTTTKRTTYSDSALSVANTNPIVLDSAGRALVFLSARSHKLVLAPPTDTDPPTSPVWTQDNVAALSAFATNLDLSGTAGEMISVNDVVYLSDGNGGTTAGRWYRADADQAYSSTGAVIIGIATSAASSGDTVTIRRGGQATGLSSLTPGAVYYVSSTAGGLTSTAPTNAIVVGKADSTTSLVLGLDPGDAGVTIRGLVTTGAQTFAGVKTFTSQPQVYVGAATTLPATVGGVYFTDVTQHAVAQSQTDSVLSTTEIPANMLNADGKAVRVCLGGSVAMTGTNNKVLELDVGGTQVVMQTFSGTADASWWAEAVVVRIDSDSVDVAVMVGGITSGIVAKVARVNGLDLAASVALRSLITTAASTTFTQTYFTAAAEG